MEVLLHWPPELIGKLLGITYRAIAFLFSRLKKGGSTSLVRYIRYIYRHNNLIYLAVGYRRFIVHFHQTINLIPVPS
jgi:hypothetical protein